MSEPLITNTTIREYFHGSITDVVVNQQIEIQPEIVYYLVNLLTEFSRSEKMFEQTGNGVEFKPLALRLADAVEEHSSMQRARLLQKLGDISLFVAGVFPDSLIHRLVDVDYYIAVGGSAYSSASESMRNTPKTKTLQQLFNELTEKFVVFVDVLAEVSEQTHLASNADLLRTYEVWVRTGSKRAEQRLRRRGVTPFVGFRPNYIH